MTVNRWIGDATSRRQINRIVVLSTQFGASAKVSIKGKTLRYTVGQAEARSRQAIVAALKDAVDAMVLANPPIGSITTATAVDDSGNVVGVDVYGEVDGTPFEFSATGDVSSEVQEVTSGKAGKNCKHVISIPGSPTGGTFTVTYGGDTTAGIAYNASAATLQTALTGLTSIGSGNVSVTGSNGGPYTIEWIGDYAEINPEGRVGGGGGVPPTGEFVLDGSSLTAASYGAYVRTVQTGGGRKNCIQKIRVVGTPDGGKLYLRYGQNYTSGIAYNGTASDVQTALVALSEIGTGNVVVTGSYADGFVVEFVGKLAGKKCKRLQAERSVLRTDNLYGAGVFEVTRVDTDTAETLVSGTSLVVTAAILVSPYRDGTVPAVVTVSVTNPITAKSFSFTFEDGEDASVVQERLAALPGVGDYNVMVTAVEEGYRFDMVGTFGAYDWAASDDDAESGGGVLSCTRGGTSSLIRQKKAASNLYWLLKFRSANAYDTISGSPAQISLTGPNLNGESSTATFDANDTIADINAALASATGISGGTVQMACVASEVGDSAAGQRIIKFELTRAYVGSYLMNPLPTYDITATCTKTALEVESIMVQQGEEGRNTIHEIGYKGYPCDGSTSITVVGDCPLTANYGSEASDINAALTALLGETTEEVREVYRDPTSGTVWLEWYGSRWHGLTVEKIEITGNSLSGVNVRASRINDAQEAVSAEQVITIRNATGGTFTIALEGQTTSGIAWNAEAGMVQSALEALSNVAPGDVVVYGEAGGPWRVVFTSSYATGPTVDLMTLGVGSLTADDVGFIATSLRQSSTGPEHFDNPDNWSLGMPASGQVLHWTNSARHCRYGLYYPTIVPDKMLFDASYTGEIGLHDYDGDLATTGTKELTLGTSGSGILEVMIGQGEGGGSPFIRLNTGSKETLLVVDQTGNPQGEDVAVMWRGTHASNVVSVNRGKVGIGVGQDVATVATLRIGYVVDQEGDSAVVVGEGVTLGDVVKSGGAATIMCAVDTLTNDSGDTTIGGEGAVAEIVINGGTVYYNSTGTLTDATVSNGGVLSFDRDLRTKTVTNPIDVYGDDADVSDRWMKVTGLEINYNRTTRQVGLGVGYRITRLPL